MKKNQQTKHSKPNKAEQECGSAAAVNVTGSRPEMSGKVIRTDEGVVREHLDRVVVRTVEETRNAVLQAEADALCGAKRYEHSAARVDTRAGHYERQLQTKAGEVSLKMPKLRRLPFETAIIERYRRRESSVEEALVEPNGARPPDRRSAPQG